MILNSAWKKKLHLVMKFLQNFVNHESPRLLVVRGPGGLGVKRGAVSVIGGNGVMGTMVVLLFTGGFL